MTCVIVNLLLNYSPAKSILKMFQYENFKINYNLRKLVNIVSMNQIRTCERTRMSPRGGGANRRFKTCKIRLDKCGIKLAFNLSSTQNLIY